MSDDLDLLAPRGINICQNCTRKFSPFGIYQCANGHRCCSLCVDDEISSCSPKLCPRSRCGSEICRMDVEKETSQYKKPSKMFTNGQPLNRATLVRNCFLNLHHPRSFRPVKCPYAACGRCVGVSNFAAHFRHEHDHVTILKTCFEDRNGTKLQMDEIARNECMCIALLDIIDQFGKLIHFESCEPYLKRPLILVMANRITNMDQDNTESSIGYDFYFGTKDILFFWVASTIRTSYKYTIAVSKIDQMVRVKYHGPMSIISEDGFELCHKGRGLTISSEHIRGMNVANEGVSLDIVIHGKAVRRIRRTWLYDFTVFIF